MTEFHDHDLLIRIETKVDHIQNSFLRHCEEEAADRAVMKRDLTAAHRRMDQMQFAGVLALIILAITIWMKA